MQFLLPPKLARPRSLSNYQHGVLRFLLLRERPDFAEAILHVLRERFRLLERRKVTSLLPENKNERPANQMRAI